MRIFGLVCYFLMLFYGAELVVEELSIDQPTSSLEKRQEPLKETVENSTVCVYYPSYKVCKALSSK
ncbi:hypothetical protein [Lysinibacillus sphaericus]|uniref:hypothetical protein n=1 Tax=Lysinibacillus sphaericus TaxID=1421 RepID=UPI000CDE86A5|nr:hypothetical protein [Lysinibacillus sphaericus]